ncbi:acyl-CoA-binding protein (ACBP)/diazepam binding inhibitor (DBI)/endozepine (EP) [Meyerozyma guilliermondii]
MPSQEFTDIAAKVQNLSKRPGNQELLKLYGLYKQATVGDNDTTQPSAFSFEAKAKWSAWKENEGTSQEDAEAEYIAFAKELIEKYN